MPQGKGTYESKEEKDKKTKFWRILKKREGKQDILLEKRKKARQEPLDTYAKGGSVKGYKAGGSVSRGQYPVQTQKVKFKGVF